VHYLVAVEIGEERGGQGVGGGMGLSCFGWEMEHVRNK